MINITIPEIKRIEAIAGSSSAYISFSQGALKIGGIPREIMQHLQKELDTNDFGFDFICSGIVYFIYL